MSDGGSEGYGRFPRSLLTSGQWAGLRPAARAVLGVLLGSANPRGCAWPSVASIATAAGLARGSVSRALDELVAAGVIVRTRPGGGRGRSTVYTLPSVAALAANPRAGADVSDRKPPRQSRETSAPARGNLRASAAGTDENRLEHAPAPDAPALERRRPAWRDEPGMASRAGMIEHAIARRDGAGAILASFGGVDGLVEAGLVELSEVRSTEILSLAGTILDRIAAQGGASVRSGA